MKTTSQIFHDLNTRLIQSLIDNEPPEARGCVDPNDTIFNIKLSDYDRFKISI